MPRIREAIRSGIEGLEVLHALAGAREVDRPPGLDVIDSAAPPRASPSSFVRMKPVVSTSVMNARACTTAS